VLPGPSSPKLFLPGLFLWHSRYPLFPLTHPLTMFIVDALQNEAKSLSCGFPRFFLLAIGLAPRVGFMHFQIIKQVRDSSVRVLGSVFHLSSE